MKMERPQYYLYSLLIFGGGGALFIIFSMIIEMVIGSPSSTSALAVLAIVPFGIICGVVGLILGAIYTKIGRYSTSKIFHLSALKFSLVVGSLFLVTSLFVPLKRQVSWNIHNSPRVIIDKKVISNEKLSEIEQKVEEFIISKEGEKEWNSVYKCNAKYEVSFDSDSLTVKYIELNKVFKYSLKGYDYIRDVKCWTFSNPFDNAEYLLVYKKLRATSGNIIYSIFDSKGICIYRELKKRRKRV
jgi:hypothetical protein